MAVTYLAAAIEGVVEPRWVAEPLSELRDELRRERRFAARYDGSADVMDGSSVLSPRASRGPGGSSLNTEASSILAAARKRSRTKLLGRNRTLGTMTELLSGTSKVGPSSQRYRHCKRGARGDTPPDSTGVGVSE